MADEAPTVFADPSSPVARVRRALEPVKALNFAVGAEKSSTYRALMAVFAAEHQRYVVTLAADDVLRLLEASPWTYDLDDDDEIDAALGYLESLRLLRRTREGNIARTRAEYLASRDRWQITEIGVAAQAAVATVEETLGRTGSLQQVMLGAIAADLDALVEIYARLVDGDVSAGAEASRRFESLNTYFRNLTSNSSTFLANLDRLTSSGDIDRDSFRLAKTLIHDYVTEFIAVLDVQAPNIARAMTMLDAEAVERLAAAAAAATEIEIGLVGDDPRAARADELRRRWSGLVAWFVGADGARPIYASLEESARTAVVSLVSVLVRMQEAKLRTINNLGDFLALARFFAAALDDDAAHLLWRTAFGIWPARHFTRGLEDPEQVPARTSWLDAPPIPVPQRIRSHGTNATPGRNGPILDTSAVRALLAEKQRVATERREAAAARFVARGAVLLSELRTTDEDQFALLLEFLGRVLVLAPSRERVCRSEDGRLTIRLLEPEAGMTEAVIASPGGTLRAPDYCLEISVPASIATRRTA